MKQHINPKEAQPLQNVPPACKNMRPAEAALYTGLSESTLAKLRMRHNRSDGPKFAKINGCVIYRRVDLDRWIESCTVDE